jgi:tRNA-specific 2-thiouridylase
VDSTTAAHVLKSRGFDVAAFYLHLTDNPDALAAARQAARLLELDLTVLDVRAEFDRLVIDPFVRRYAQAVTPSPCVFCNPIIKFGLLWEKTAAMGAVALATGHYAAKAVSAEGKPRLIRPLDAGKDQTYFLSRLTPEMIGRAVFPLADWTKDRVKATAAGLGLPPRPESQEICFLQGRDYRSLLADRLPASAMAEGDFVDAAGRALGRHRGLPNYTVGQRRGLDLPGPEAYYVLALDPEKNQVVIGGKEETAVSRIMVTDLVLSVPPPEPSFDARVMIRSRHRPAPARVRLLGEGVAEVVFHAPQASPAPGQAAVFYQKNTLLGGGWISR